MAESPTVIADRARLHEENFPVWRPGLMDVPTNSKFITCVSTEPPDLFCEHRPHVNPDGVMVDWSAIIVEMKAMLKRKPAFYFTFDGDKHEPGFKAEAELHALDALGKEKGGLTSELVQTWRSKGSAMDMELLQIYWAPSGIVKEATEGISQDSMSYMPVYDSDNNQHAFKTLADIPFESRVRV